MKIWKGHSEVGARDAIGASSLGTNKHASQTKPQLDLAFFYYILWNKRIARIQGMLKEMRPGMKSFWRWPVKQ